MRYKSRKFLVCAGSIVLASALLYINRVTETGWSTVTLAAIAAYCTANVVQKKQESAE